MKILIFIFTILVNSFFLFGAKPLTVLSEVLTPIKITVSNENIYIIEKYRIHIYNKNTLKLKKSFGKFGQGPKEFPGIIGVNYFNDQLVVPSLNKILWFSKEGNYIKERKKHITSFVVLPIPGGFLKNKFKFPKAKGYTLNLILISDLEHNVKKIIFKKKIDFFKNRNKKELQVLKGRILPLVDNQNIILGDVFDNYAIKLFDLSGNFLKTIKYKFKKYKVSEKFKKEYIKHEIYSLKDPRFQNKLKSTKIKFPEFLPPFNDLFSEGKMIYVIRDIPDYFNSEVIIMTKEGKILKALKVPKPKCYCIKNGIYYYIQENEENEEWELYSQKLY